jgi:colanic acid biosynthesis glycosyl transferase WcaI
VARAVASAIRRPFWVHVQDLEMEMALATGNLPHTRLRACLFRALERFALAGDRISSISAAMCDRLAAKKGVCGRIVEFRNWARPDIGAAPEPSPYRFEWGLGRRHVALYSGNLAAKQGIEIIIAAARLLAHRSDILFVICGNGPNRAMLERSAAGCPTIAFFDLQPAERLSDLLATATIHLLPQIAGAADLVLPSKLPNMLASGRPVVATAERGTGLWQEVEGCGIVTRPHDAMAFAGAITRLIDDAPLRDELGVAARARAAERWSKDAILGSFERDLRGLVADRQRDRAWRRGIAQPLAQQERASNVEVAQG